MEDCVFDIDKNLLEHQDFSGVYLISSKKDEEGKYILEYMFKHLDDSITYPTDKLPDTALTKKIINEQLLRTLRLVIYFHNKVSYSAVDASEENFDKLRFKKNLYFLLSAAGLTNTYLLSKGINNMSAGNQNGLGLIICSLIGLALSCSFYLDYKSLKNACANQRKKSDEFILDEGLKLIRKK